MPRTAAPPAPGMPPATGPPRGPQPGTSRLLTRPPLAHHCGTRCLPDTFIAAVWVGPPSLHDATGAAAGCSAAGATGTDHPGDCAALLAIFSAWKGHPPAWASGIAAGASYCSWDPYLSGPGDGTIECTDGRVTALCATPS